MAKYFLATYINHMNFKKWLVIKESGTTSSSIAVFKMPVFSNIIRRKFPKIKV